MENNNPNQNIPQEFQPITLASLIETLGLTIKKDEENKLVTFLCELSAYSEDAQFNISYNAPSSTGKSFIPLEIAKLFPASDLLKLGACSPQAFFHEQGELVKETNTITIDLSRKIIIFMDQPHMDLLARLRSLLSHDQKEMVSKITDKSQKGGNKTKTVIIKGYPSVIFCSAGFRIDEQESTRFFLLSPEVNQEKIREAITQKIRKESDNDKYRNWLEEIPERKLLKKRILAIKKAGIGEIKIADSEKITERFFNQNQNLKPRHQRDVGRLLSLVKSLALLNFWWRNLEGSTITANQEDVDQAFELWNKIAITQELNLPPYIYNLYTEVILPLWESKNPSSLTGEKEGLSRPEIIKRHYELHSMLLDNEKLRQQILPMLENAGLIYQERQATDKRKVLIYPTVPTFISPDKSVRGDESGKVQVPDFMIDVSEGRVEPEPSGNLPLP